MLGIGVPVMHTVVGRPPKRTSLSRSTCDEGTQELDSPASFKGAVREIAVVKSSDRKHPCCIGKKENG